MPEERDAEIIRLRRKGYSFMRIADELQLTKGIVAGVVKRKLGRTERDLQPLDYLAIYQMRIKGTPGGEVAKHFGVGRNRVVTIAHRYPEAIERDNRDLRLCRMIDEGYTNQQIAAMVRVRTGTVQAMRNELEAL